MNVVRAVTFVLFGHLFDVVARTRVVGQIHNARKTVQHIAHCNINRLAKDSIPKQRKKKKKNKVGKSDEECAIARSYFCIEYPKTCVLPPPT